MKYKISCIGKISREEENKIINRYKNRIRNKITINEYPQSNKEKEAQVILKSVPKSSKLIVLDKQGGLASTEQLVKIVKFYEMENIKILNFAIGGAQGHGLEIRNRADKIISFGKMTWSHIIARLMLVEQLYRVECILNNHPYHK